MSKYGIGQPVRRFEDPRLVRGEGRYIDDANLPGQVYAVFVRSPHAHAKIRAIDVADAQRAPGIVAVYTGHDVEADGLGMPRAEMPRKRPDGRPMFAPQRPALVTDRVRYVGDPVAMVIAGTLAEAKDAAELVAVDYEPLPSVTSTEDTVKTNAPAVWDECPDNVSNHVERGNKAATDEAFKAAAKVIKRRYVISRVHAQYMEPRGALADYDSSEDRMILYADVQYPHRVRNLLAQSVFKVPENKIRVIAGDIGGAFGTKGPQYIEQRLVLWAAKKLRRPVKWTCERSEAMLADEHARDNIGEIELALDEGNRFLALRLNMLANLGAYVASDRNLITPFFMISTVLGVYRIPTAYLNVVGVLSNTNPTAPYRGAGRPEAIYLIERLIDDAARELGVDRIALRRKNILPESALPYQSPLGPYYDCGQFEKNMDLAIEFADVAGFARRAAESKRRGKLRGLGIINAIEQAAGTVMPEFAEIRFDASGSATLLMGTKAQGQGHETMYKQILNDRLGLDPNEVQFIDGDTDRVAYGVGTMGSRSAVLGGSALYLATGKVIEKGKRLASHLLEASADDIEFAAGNFRVKGTDKVLAFKEVVRAAFNPFKWPKGFEGGMYETATFLGQRDTYPNGCHICEAEIDPETGETHIDRYFVVDDVGTVLNPLGLKGQIQGGIAQGLGQILHEQVVWDRESGQLLTASFLDYAMPRADTVPEIEVKSNPVPTKYNPLGAKGAGEAGTVGAMPAVMNAIMDALAPLRVKDVPMPASPANVWQAIQDATHQ